MKKFVLAFLVIIILPSVIAAAPKQNIDDGEFVPRGEYRLKGWFYADALITDTNPGEEPVVVYDGPFSFKVTYGPSGGHSYFGVLCGPRDSYLHCEPEPVVELPYGPGYPVTTTIIGTADAAAAEFDVNIDVDGNTYSRFWEITEVSTQIPNVQAINTMPPKFVRDVDEVLAKEVVNTF